MRQELLNELLSSIGEQIEGIGEAIQNEMWSGLAQKMEDLRSKIRAVELVVEMRGRQ